MKTELGGDRLGSGNKQEISMRNYERSTHDLGYIWRSSMSAGTLVPFLTEIALPGDVFNIDLNLNVRTLPTLGPLFGSYKIQADIFQLPIRLYQGKLHMNMLNIGMDMSAIKLPRVKMESHWMESDDDNLQINPSSIWSYLGIRGLGRYNVAGDEGDVMRYFNAVPYLGYWDIYKQYYSNKQEERGFVIHYDTAESVYITNAYWFDDVHSPTDILNNPEQADITGSGASMEIDLSGALDEDPDFTKIFIIIDGVSYPITDVFNDIQYVAANNWITCANYYQNFGQTPIVSMSQQTLQAGGIAGVSLSEFDLENIDTMRMNILADVASANAFEIDKTTLSPYGLALTEPVTGLFSMAQSQEGLAIKTYQSDLLNNWISTEWIDGVNGIADVTAVSTAGDEFTIDALNLANKVYNMLNRIAISGGTYDDWLDAVYTHERSKGAENPIYHGSLIKELSFEEVVNQSEFEDSDGTKQPLGTLAGRGRLTDKHKGGKIRVDVHEPSYLMGIVSITPRVDYSQGNKWDVNLETMDDLHKPALDEIGYQDLLTDQMCWFDTVAGNAGSPTFQSAGKQPAWINYMTNVNQVRGNFADIHKEMFMTLNRRYEMTKTGAGDITTYIDPVKFNQIFADTNLDAQNFWVQISVKNIARRKMSAKVIPNL